MELNNNKPNSVVHNGVTYDHFCVLCLHEKGKDSGPFAVKDMALWVAKNRNERDEPVVIHMCTTDGRVLPGRRLDGGWVEEGTKLMLPFQSVPEGAVEELLDTQVPLPAKVPVVPVTPKAAPKAAAKPLVVTPGEQGSLVFTGVGTAGQVLEASRQRVERHEQHMADFGLKLPPPVYAPGSLVHQEAAGGMFRVSHKDWAAQPLSVDGLMSIQARVEAERRKDFTVHAHTLRMDERGFIYREGGGGARLGVEPKALQQFASRCAEHFPRAGEFLAALSPSARAVAFNAQIVKVAPELELKLRVRRPEGTTTGQIYSMVGKAYAPYDIDRLVGSVLPELRKLSDQFEDRHKPRGMAVYDPSESTLRADILWHADRIVDASAGDVFKAGLRMRTSDTGGGAVVTDLVAFRNRCLNFIIIGAGSAQLVRAVHRGNISSLEVNLAQAVQTADQLMKGFEEDWGLLRHTPINKVTLYGEKFPDVQTALKAMVDAKRIDGVTAAAVATEAILTAWKEEPGQTLADLVNAVTRYAQKTSENTKDRIQRSAGELVPVLVHRAEAAR